jgi:hypothetical protein
VSRSNTNYYNICPWHDEVGEDAYCDIHCNYSASPCLVPREFLSRRGVVRRQRRFLKHFKKSWHSGPPSWWWRMQHNSARAIQRAEMLPNPDDPVVSSDKR